MSLLVLAGFGCRGCACGGKLGAKRNVATHGCLGCQGLCAVEVLELMNGEPGCNWAMKAHLFHVLGCGPLACLVMFKCFGALRCSARFLPWQRTGSDMAGPLDKLCQCLVAQLGFLAWSLTLSQWRHTRRPHIICCHTEAQTLDRRLQCFNASMPWCHSPLLPALETRMFADGWTTLCMKELVVRGNVP